MNWLGSVERGITYLALIAVPLVAFDTVSDPDVSKEMVFKSVVCALAFIYMIRSLTTGSYPSVCIPIARCVLAFVVLAEASLLWSGYRAIGVPRLESILFGMVFYFLASQLLRDMKTANRALAAASIAGFVVSGLGIADYLGVYRSVEHTSLRAYSTFGHPNLLGSYLVSVIPVSAALCVGSRLWRTKVLYGLSMVAACVCVVLTLSRGAMLSMVGGLIVLFLLLRRGGIGRDSAHKFMRVGLVLVCIVVLAAGVFVIGGGVAGYEYDRLVNVFARDKNNSVWLRWLEWKGTLAMIRSEPLLGTGIGTFSIYFPLHQPAEFETILDERKEYLSHAENEYLEQWAEMGVLAPILFALVIAAACRKAMRLREGGSEAGSGPVINGVLAALSGVCINMFVDIGFRYVAVPMMFWLYVGMIDGLTVSGVEAKGEGKRRWVYLAYAAAAVVLAYSYVNGVNYFRADQEYRQAEDEFGKGHYGEALTRYVRAGVLNPSKPEIHYKKAALEGLQGRWEEAIRTYEQLEAVHPHFIHAHFNKSVSYYNAGDLGNAIREGKKELAIYPHYATQLLIMGRSYYKLDEFVEAERYVGRYLMQEPGDEEALSYMGNIYAYRSDWKKAASVYRSIVAKSPDELMARLNLAQMNLNSGELKELCDNMRVVVTKGRGTGFLDKNRATVHDVVGKMRQEYGGEDCVRSVVAEFGGG